ncbi:MAG TPA: hypothetical protein PKE63_07835 [Lacibacter sp.]|nr:hypothetical protein [Lacibacter sp.]HMO89564.1 hypothetical protein [Lacibacter sp.]HMP87175.1 hypothetical protein [Lacibacter sp.]
MSTQLLLHFERLPEDDRERIMRAVDRLCKDNPDFPRQLEKLAEIREEKPSQWALGKKVLKL